MEHTGIYCLPLLEFLVENKIRVCLESPLQIKNSQGIVRGKNDKVDAKRIAVYAYKNRETLTLWHPQRLIVQKIKALLVTRDRLVKVRTILCVPITECEEFIEKSIYKLMGKSCQKSIHALEGDIKNIEQRIDQLVKEDQSLKEQYSLATSVTGIGKITALNMIVSTGEFTRITESKKFACYSGVAPFENTSGTTIKGKPRVSNVANMTIKTLLTMGAMSAIQHDPFLRTYYKRKVTAGKSSFNVINAVRNKLISRVFACIKEKRMYQKDYKYALA
jgi:transposase